MTPKEEYQLQQDLQTYNATLTALYSAAFKYDVILLGINTVFFVLLYVNPIFYIVGLVSITLTTILNIYIVHLNIETLHNLISQQDSPHMDLLKTLMMWLHLLTGLNVILMFLSKI